MAGEEVWLGVARPGLVRGAQWLFRGRLEQDDGTWSLVGATQLGLSTRVRLGVVVVLGFVIVASRVVAPIQGTELRPIDVIIGLVGVGVMLLPYALFRSSVSKGTKGRFCAISSDAPNRELYCEDLKLVEVARWTHEAIARVFAVEKNSSDGIPRSCARKRSLPRLLSRHASTAATERSGFERCRIEPATETT